MLCPYLPNFYSVLNDKISFSVLLWFPVTKKIAAYESEIRFDPSPILEIFFFFFFFFFQLLFSVLHLVFLSSN
jgi:hypothetical protein